MLIVTSQGRLAAPTGGCLQRGVECDVLVLFGPGEEAGFLSPVATQTGPTVVHLPTTGAHTLTNV